MAPRIPPNLDDLVNLSHLDEVIKPLASTAAARQKLVTGRRLTVVDDLRSAPGFVEDGQVRRFLTKSRANAAVDRAESDKQQAAALAEAFAEAAPRWAKQVRELTALLQRGT